MSFDKNSFKFFCIQVLKFDKSLVKTNYESNLESIYASNNINSA